MTPPTTDTSREAVHRSCNQSDLGHLSDQLLSDVCRALLAERDALRDQLAVARNEALEEAAYQAQNACLVPPDGGAPTAEEAAVCDEAARRIRALKSIPAPRGVTLPDDLQLSPTTNPLPDTCIHMTYDMSENCPHCNPGGPAPREDWQEHADKASAIIRGSAEREVTVQEAARVFADVMQDLLGEPRGSIPETADAFYDGSLGRFTDRRILRALAKEKGDE